MPWVTINMLTGVSDEKKRALHKNVAKTIAATLEMPVERVRIQLTEMEDIDHSIGGQTIEVLGR